MEQLEISSDYFIFTCTSEELNENSILKFVGKISAPNDDLNKIRSRYLNRSKLKEYIIEIETLYSEIVNEVLLITKYDIFLLDLLRNTEAMKIHAFDKPIQFQEIVAELHLNIIGLDEIYKRYELDKFPIEIGGTITITEYMAYIQPVDTEEFRKLLGVISQEDRLKQLSDINQSSNRIIQGIVNQIKHYNEREINPNVNFEMIFQLLQELNQEEYKCLNFIIKMLNEVFGLEVYGLADHVNKLFLGYINKDINYFLYDNRYLFNIFLHLFTFEAKSERFSEEFLNVINTIGFILKRENVGEELNFILYSLGIKLYITWFKEMRFYGNSHKIDFMKFSGMLFNFYQTTQDMIKQQSGSQSTLDHLEKTKDEIIAIFKDIQADDNWLIFVIKEIESVNEYQEFLKKEREISKNSDINGNIPVIRKRVSEFFNIHNDSDIFSLFEIHVLQELLDDFHHETELDPNQILEEISVFDYLKDLISNTEAEIIRLYEEYIRSTDAIDIHQQFNEILFDMKLKDQQLDGFIEFYNNGLTSKYQIYYIVKRFRMLWWIINNIDNLDSSQIHQLLDIFELKSTNSFDRETLLTKLLRAYLNQERLDDITKYYLKNYLDRSDDDTTLSLDVLREILEELTSSNTVSVDIGDLRMEMEQELNEDRLEDEIRDRSVPELPKALFDLFPDDGIIPDYFIYYHTYHHVRRRLGNVNLDHEIRELLKYLINHFPFAKSLSPYFREITDLRHNYRDIVDDVQYKLLEIEILGRIFPEEGIRRLDEYRQEIIEQDLNPTIEDYHWIINIFQSLYHQVEGYDKFEEYMTLSRQLEIIDKYFIEIYPVKGTMEAFQKIGYEDYQILEHNEELVGVIDFVLQMKYWGKDDQNDQLYRNSRLKTLLSTTLEAWDNPESLKKIVQEWSNLPQPLIEVIDTLALEFEHIRGLTSVRLYLIEQGLFGVDHLSEIIAEQQSFGYLLPAYQLTICYFIQYDRNELARNVLETLSASYGGADFQPEHLQVLINIANLASYLGETGWIDGLKIWYEEKAGKKQYAELEQMIKNPPDKIENLYDTLEPLSDIMVELFQQEQGDNILDEFL